MHMYIFFLPSPTPIPIAMGALETVDKMYNDLALADPLTHRVLVSKLFVYPEYAGKGYGGEVMDFLEGRARGVLGARWLTINTTPWEPEGEGKTPNRVKEWCEYEHKSRERMDEWGGEGWS